MRRTRLVMRFLRTILAAALAVCVLSAGAQGYASDQKKGDRKEPPPKQEKVVPKENKEPRNDGRRNEDRNRGNDNKRRGHG
jgi:hypothetical protein